MKAYDFMKAPLFYPVAFLALLAWCGIAGAGGKVVAKVGVTEITEAELQDAISRYVPPGVFHSGGDASQKEKYRTAALNELIEHELFYQEALVRGIAVPDGSVDKVIDANIKRFGSKEKMEKNLEQHGITLADFRQKIRKYELASALRKKLTEESACSEEQARAYYDENKQQYNRPEAVFVSHIVLKVEPTVPDEEWKKKGELAEGLRKRILSGEDFGSIAEQYSEDQYRVKGGEMGYIHRGRLTPKELEEAALSLNPGEISPVIRTIYGYHIIRAGERKPQETVPFEEVKGKITKELEKKRFENRKTEVLERQKKAHPVVIHGADDSR